MQQTDRTSRSKPVEVLDAEKFNKAVSWVVEMESGRGVGYYKGALVHYNLRTVKEVTLSESAVIVGGLDSGPQRGEDSLSGDPEARLKWFRAVAKAGSKPQACQRRRWKLKHPPEPESSAEELPPPDAKPFIPGIYFHPSVEELAGLKYFYKKYYSGDVEDETFEAVVETLVKIMLAHPVEAAAWIDIALKYERDEGLKEYLFYKAQIAARPEYREELAKA